MKVKISADSTCDLSAELVEKYDVGITPLSVIMGQRSGRDGVDVFPEDIYAYVAASGTLPKTSAVNTADYYRQFRQWTELGYGVVHFSLGGKFSSSCQNARLAAQALDNVYVVDSCNLSTGQGLLVLMGAELARQGKDPAEICSLCQNAAPRVEASFLIDTMDHLYKGGRCSGLAAFGANLLNIKPCIEVRDGAMEPSRRYRGRIEKVIVQYVRDRLQGRTDIDTHRIFVTHSSFPEEGVKEVIAAIRELQPGFEEILETSAGSVVTTHCGPNTLGVLFLRRE